MPATGGNGRKNPSQDFGINVSIAVKDAMSLSTVLALALQQSRRDAILANAPKSVTDEAKRQLRAAPITSKTLFGGQVESVYRDNMELNRNILVNNSIIQQNKSGNSGSFQKPRGKAPKKKNSKTKPQESPKPQTSTTAFFLEISSRSFFSWFEFKRQRWWPLS